jgi:TM2 domain-containing membrane protein YozV
MFRSKILEYLLWLVGGFGILGLHRLYLGKVGTALIWFFTLWVCGIGAFIDLFTLGEQVDQVNTKVELRSMRRAAYYRR